MTVEALVVRYGLVAILIGAGIEGEAVVVAGGVLAHRHLVPLGGAMACATIGSFAVDQLWFALGRRFREHRWVQRARAKPAFGRAMALLERWPSAFIFAFRFLWGLRTVSPIAIGTSRIPSRTFLILNALAAAVWAPTFTLIGYWGGGTIDPLLAKLRGKTHVVILIAVVLIAVAAATQLVRILARRRGHATPAGPPG